MTKAFANDVIKWLTSKEKHLSSKYFYNDVGSRIFQEIMHRPEYNVTDNDFEILSKQAEQIIAAVGFGQPFNVVELGAGDGSKTFKLLAFSVTKKYRFLLRAYRYLARGNGYTHKKPVR